MIDDPYQVLGIEKGADKEDIKKAYRKKAKEYHPDLHPDDPLAAQKMNEINEAYDMLNNPEKYQKKQESSSKSSYSGNGSPYGNPFDQGYGGGWGYGNGQGGYGSDPGDFGGFGFEELFGFRRNRGFSRPQSEPGDSESIRQAVDFINMRRYDYAAQCLNSVISSQRNARWYYLSSLVSYGQGNEIQAVEQIGKAVQMEPGNTEYRKTLEQMQQRGGAYHEAGQEYQQSAGSMVKVCGNFFMLQFLCMFCRC